MLILLETILNFAKIISPIIFYSLLFFLIMDRVTPIRNDYHLGKKYFYSIINDTFFLITNVTFWKVTGGFLGIFLIDILPPSPLLSITNTINEFPLGIKVFIVLFIAEFFHYWLHRMYHQVGFLWDVHKVHHSGKVLIWSHTHRVHIIQYFISAVINAFLYYLILPEDLSGQSNLNITFIVAVSTSFYTFLGHSNFNLSFGWFNRIFASPLMHHWHHADCKYDKNFSGIFSCFDWIFGTIYLPPGDKYPESYGIKRELKENYWSLFQLPFREWRQRIKNNKKKRA